MDLANLDIEKAADEGAVLHLRHPVTFELLMTDGAEPKPISMTLCGFDSKKYQKATAKVEDKLREMMRNRGRDLTDEEKDDILSEKMAALVTGWENIVFKSAKPLPFTPENVRMLFNERKWVRQQVSIFAADRSNFWKEPSKA